jgi:hypothetical protein
MPRRSGHNDRKRANQLVMPLDGDRIAALRLDRRARDRSVIAPNRRFGHISVETMLSCPHSDDKAAFILGRDQAPRHGQSVYERE